METRKVWIVQKFQRCKFGSIILNSHHPIMLYLIHLFEVFLKLLLESLSMWWKQPLEVFCKKMCVRPATLLKKRLWHRYFRVNFTKFLRTRFFIQYLQETASDVIKTGILKCSELLNMNIWSYDREKNIILIIYYINYYHISFQNFRKFF